ncbi:LysR family transcriptional regulator [Nocardia pneumoniae]|uniref:LysR family transcriptional regulator n=1 Tax=Nocardia pneumoniae TaxID=228601 RepID=UPI000316456E|nr:LysR family transcriptional regulator [Nocardia pneumoniae]
MDLDTALLRALVATAEEGHFGRAADRLFVTQQALSKRIARLEQILGARVLERTRRTVRLTATGERFLPYARDVVDAVDAAASAAGIGGPVRVDVMDAHTAAAGLVRRVVDQDPNLSLQITARGARSTAVDALRSGDVDVAFGRASAVPWPAEIRRRCVLLEPVGLLLSAGHPLSACSQVTMADLAHIALRFPMHDAPPDWVNLVDELTATFGIMVDRAGSNLGFDHFLDQTAGDPTTATFYGLHMPPPGVHRLRVVPIVAPTPMFAWAAMWRRRVPDSIVNRLTRRGSTTIPDDAWLPTADRAWLVR